MKDFYNVKSGPNRTENGGWAVVEDLRTDTLHVMPIDDTGKHEMSQHCGCQTLSDPEDHRLVIHNAWDQRQKYERGERKVS